MDEHVSAVFVVGAVDKGFATGCQADRDSITGNWRRFFDKLNFVAKSGRRPDLACSFGLAKPALTA